jgi:hypothetical protein
MARLQCIIAGRLLKYGDAPRSGETTGFLNEMEMLLQQAASEMPPQWWLVPDLTCSDGRAPDPFHDVARINYQFSHYHLVMRLHLPYMLGSPGYAHSKIAAASAGRETLARYIAFRRWNPGHFYCRGVDYVAFIALTVLCLAHIDASTFLTQDQQLSTSPGRILAQNHLSDRGLMERTLEIIRAMGNDPTASKLACVMQHLLDVEADADKGTEYSATVAAKDEGRVEYGGDVNHSDNTLKLCIPYFGTINLLRKVRSQTPLVQWDYHWSQQPISGQENLDPHNNDTELAGNLAPALDACGDWTLQSINESLFSSLFGGVEDQEELRNF